MQPLRPISRFLLPLLGGILLFAQPAAAGVFTAGCASQNACTLQELIDGGVITAGGTIFARWAIERDPGTVDFNRVVVEGLGEGGLDPGPGLRIQGNGELRISGTGELDLRLGFIAQSIYPNFRVHDNLLEVIASATTGSGQIAVDENVFDTELKMLAWTDVRVDPAFGDVRSGDMAEFGNQLAIYVEKDILLNGRTVADSASLDTLIQRFSQATVPEPRLGVGLLVGVALLGRLASRKRPPAIAASAPADTPTAHLTPGPPGGTSPCA